MRHIRSKSLILLIIAGFFVLFAGTNAALAADDEVQTECTNDLGWTVELLGGSAELLDNCDINTELCYLWTYQVQSPKSDTKGLNHINFNISAHPYYSSNIATLVEEYNGSATVGKYFDGAGEPTTDFGKGILQDYVVKFTPQSIGGIWSFISNTDNMATGTVGLKINNNLGLCEIGVPYKTNEPEFAAMAVSSEQIITTADNKKFRILEDPYTQCILKAQYWDGDSWEDMTKSDIQTTLKIDEGGYSEYAEYFGVPGQGCPRAIIKREGEHTWYFISGRWVWR